MGSERPAPPRRAPPPGPRIARELGLDPLPLTAAELRQRLPDGPALSAAPVGPTVKEVR